MKKNLKRLAIPCLAISLIAPASVSAIFDAQLGVGYNSLSIKDNGSAGTYYTTDQTFKGAAINGSAHLNFSIPLVLSIGVGPYIVVGPDLNYSGGNLSGVTYANTQFSIGGEIQTKLLVIPVVSPYAKFGFGADTLKSVATAGGLSAELKYSGSGYRLLFGLEIPIVAVISVFAEAGISGATYDGTVFGTSGLKAKTTGAVFNFGVSLGI